MVRRESPKTQLNQKAAHCSSANVSQRLLVLGLSWHTHGEGSLVVHLGHRDISGGRVHHEDLLVVTQLELRVEGVNYRNGPVGLLEGDRHQKPVGEKQDSSGLI